MPLIVCCGCGHSVTLAKVPRRPRCSNCGSTAARTYKRIKIWMNTERSQLEPQRARLVTMSSLLYLAEQWHYSPGWAAVKYHKIFEEWPSPPRPKPTPPPEPPLPGAELVHWAVLEKARYAREQKRKLAALSSGN